MEKKITPLNKEELLSYLNHGYMTVGALKKFIEKHEIPDDALVVVQRVEDFYYEDHDWKVYLKESEHSNWMKSYNDALDKGEFDDKEKYPDFKDEMRKKFTEEQIIEASSQYHPAWCPVLYEDDGKEILFLDLHY
jgi:uncharacterized membrane protein